jgi:hypothetical protein
MVASAMHAGRLGRLILVPGVVASMAVIVLCASSTPAVAVLVGCIAAAFFLLRRYMRIVRWLALFLALALHLSMKAPVWHLISRIDISGGSTGWHRFHLIDQAIKRFDEWGLFGTPSTAHWGWGLGDVTNQFVLEGVTGGMLTLVLFIVLIALAFGECGRAWRRAVGDSWKVASAWALGVALTMHVANFLAVSYFGQITMVWYLELAMIASLSARRRVIPRPAARAAAASPGTTGIRDVTSAPEVVVANGIQ